MGYRSLQECVADLDRTGQLVRLDEEVDAYLEAAEIQRRINQVGGPAILMTRVKGCRFPMLCNLFGTLSRLRFLFRDTVDAVQKLVELKVDAGTAFKKPWGFADVPRVLWNMRPRWVTHGPVLAYPSAIGQLPQQVSWPDDGGAFITLPQVYTEDADRPGWRHSNLGMYRVQLSGGQYKPDRQVGLHYQIQRGIGVHHAAAIRRGVPFRVNIFVGGPPALAVAAVMPLPEGMPEVAFAGGLGGQRVQLVKRRGRLPILADVDFCITGTVDPNLQLPEGPFGDHLGYYSLAHRFPVLNVEQVWHREGAIWPFTVVGRPPQEDTSFGQFIHELTGPVIPSVVKGVHAVHAVDAAGVHPLLLAIGSERYVPYASVRKPQELLTCANAILGQGQLSLAKYLLIVAREDNPELNIHKIPAFFRHVLERVDWKTDLHFQTRTTIDTLDYSGTGLNEGSKAVIAVAGPPRRKLPAEIPAGLHLPEGFSLPRLCLSGILAVQAPAYAPSRNGETATEYEPALVRFCQAFRPADAINDFPLIVLVDDSEFTAQALNNFLWVTFTRSNPAADIYGIGAFLQQKHWGCEGALVIDARIKPHHAPPLSADKKIAQRVQELAAPGKPLHGII